ncbi:glycine cleavage system protein GcvH [Neolewinella lacunae]|uniref:Glycine cleavage system H protein n=1 Tax=Neolewinella lacunae TaxID=1517758 RepID=A0A923TAE4_9BACT|nr:glycine cleavage system protein GcvH [Neolewinella lacunae]MBC6996446.1 glycine cleavage system protein GcvH [Neolewinella lacunae]MDN3633611.1 glycine cleavage system protein GcvH [Neolewinella lacunae]
MNIPANLLYTHEHEWVLIEGNIATVGITDYAQDQLGELVYVEVDTVGETLERNDIFGTVEAVKTTSDLFLPLAGKILEFNSALDEKDGDNPTLVNEDPYGEGWIVKIELADPADHSGLLTAEAYGELIS